MVANGHGHERERVLMPSAVETRDLPKYAWLWTSRKGTVGDQSEMHWGGGEIREMVWLGMKMSLRTTRLHRNNHKETLMVQ